MFDRYETLFDCGSESHPCVDEHNGIVRLRFNAFDVQSEMRRKAPAELVLRYTRTMVAAIRQEPPPRSIGIIGLGGGSLAKHCYRRYPAASIGVAEINPEVIALRNDFCIPEDDHRFTVYCEDGAEFVQRHRNEFDVLLVDGFDRHGQPPQLCSAQFYQDCYRSLTARGILVVNICGNHQLIDKIRLGRWNQVTVEDAGKKRLNTVVIAGKGVPAAP
ncbi:MAG: fused MFS/spermidine synthase [Bryobacteraceae bacterium]|nr:fused MFS/spermidine synthase [Bryobacteraceae bacterium]